MNWTCVMCVVINFRLQLTISSFFGGIVFNKQNSTYLGEYKQQQIQ